jgi:osmotically-inducible protein OsmY
MQALVKRDTEIQQRVMQELTWDTRVEPADVGVEVRDGIVTLTGTVKSYAEKLAAQEAAHRVSGVLDVANDILVEVPGRHVRTDADIAHAVRHALEWSVVVPSDLIRSTVSNGWVTLEGHVITCQQRLDAETTVRYLTGVRGVINEIVVRSADAEARNVRRAIETALERRAEREAKRIQIEVENGTVTLTGWVRTWLEKQSIIGAAGHAPGITNLIDHLQVDPYF